MENSGGAKNDLEIKIEQIRQDFIDHSQSDPEKQRDVLLETIKTLEFEEIPYALIGGLAGKELGRPRVTHDIDIFVGPDHADMALEALKKEGFNTEQRDKTWLYKAWKDDILVDIIFKSAGDIYFDEEIQKHVRRVPFKGQFINSISPEDFIVIKAAVHQEHIPHHWHDALAVLTEGELDWRYLVKRARFSPRRVLALLIYAQSNDIAVPIDVIQNLYRKVFESSNTLPGQIVYPYRQSPVSTTQSELPGARDSIIYTKGRIMEALNTDERIADHDIKIFVTETSITAKGEVYTHEQKEAVRELLQKISPDKELKDNIYVRTLPGPEESEVIQ